MKRKPGKIALLLADVDGTLVTREKVLTPRALSSVAALKRAGVRFAITSGRPPRGMSMLTGPLGIETPVAAFNGGLLVKPDLSPIKERILPLDVAREALELIARDGLDGWLYAGGDWLVHRRDAPHVAREEKTVQFPPEITDDFGSKIASAIKITGVSDDRDRIEKCARDMRSSFGAKASASLSQPYYLDVTHPEATKGYVVEDLARFLNIPAGEIATIGDMPNDVSMFKKGGFAIAMGNAAQDVKDEADAVTEDCDREGFALAVETLLSGGYK